MSELREAVKPQRRAYPTVPGFYAALFPFLVIAARRHGYCLAVHGSMATDLDLLAVPWTNEASDAETLVEEIRAKVGGFVANDGDDPDSEYRRNPVTRPHGRRAWSIHFDETCHGPYIDLSVMPRLLEPTNV